MNIYIYIYIYTHARKHAYVHIIYLLVRCVYVWLDMQMEGSLLVGGKGPSVRDVFLDEHPGSLISPPFIFYSSLLIGQVIHLVSTSGGAWS